MSSVIRSAICASAVVALFSATSVSGQQVRPGAVKRAAQNQVFQLPKDITLTEEQQTKLKALVDEYSPKLAALNAKQSEILTPEQVAARAEVTKANREAKKTGKEAQAAVEAALKLTDEQKTKWAAAQKELADLRKTIEQKKRDLLTEEQKAKLPKQRAAKK
jgi:hypothetical protein